MKNKLIVIAMSGGIDSSISAWILKKMNYDLIGVHMINWTKNNNCYKTHLSDVINIANKININLKIINYEYIYNNIIFNKFIKKYKKGITPNSDIECNKKIKFNILLKYAIKIGGYKLATGHYAKIKKIKNKYKLLKAKDKKKDQTYFLYKLNNYQLSKIIFPLGNLYKKEIKKIAFKLNLSNKNKKESRGICFIENYKFKNFLNIYIKKKFGYISNNKKYILGIHDGIYFYTIGQKKNIRIENKNTKNNYVFYKNKKHNILYMTNNIKSIWLFSLGVFVFKINWIKKAKNNNYYFSKIRHSCIYLICFLKYINKKMLLIKFNKIQWGLAEGQSIVFYEKNICLGGGIIKNTINFFNKSKF
ncbi:tRNA-specific 2-thiouridylase MnmA [Candidatus Nasuia deltocephalinicola]|nr:tRNA-specific 2-thiouridylase MnmA [Candidatus Nasuia deltocephalinicola]